MNQRTLFEESGTEISGLVPASRRTDPVTSKIAAKNYVGKSEQDRRDILRVIHDHPGRTAGEIAQLLGWGNHNERVSRRTSELDGKSISKGPNRVCSVKGNWMVTWWILGTEQQP